MLFRIRTRKAQTLSKVAAQCGTTLQQLYCMNDGLIPQGTPGSYTMSRGSEAWLPAEAGLALGDKI